MHGVTAGFSMVETVVSTPVKNSRSTKSGGPKKGAGASEKPLKQWHEALNVNSLAPHYIGVISTTCCLSYCTAGDRDTISSDRNRSRSLANEMLKVARSAIVLSVSISVNRGETTAHFAKVEPRRANGDFPFGSRTGMYI